jgi:hypothetical protein
MSENMFIFLYLTPRTLVDVASIIYDDGIRDDRGSKLPQKHQSIRTRLHNATSEKISYLQLFTTSFLLFSVTLQFTSTSKSFINISKNSEINTSKQFIARCLLPNSRVLNYRNNKPLNLNWNFKVAQEKGMNKVFSSSTSQAGWFKCLHV